MQQSIQTSARRGEPPHVIEKSEQSIRSKDFLYLNEITHRALNDYANMLSIIRHASMTVSDWQAGQALNEVADRLDASAAAWQILRPPSANVARNLDRDLAVLCRALSASILVDRHITLSLAVEPVTIAAHQSWQVCLVIAELIQNAGRHAFLMSREGAISVEVRAQGGGLQCSVTDNGAARSNLSRGRGSDIVEGLAAELGGSIFRDHTAQGSTVILHIPFIANSLPSAA